MKRTLLFTIIIFILILSCETTSNNNNILIGLYEFFEISDPEDTFSGITFYVAADGNDLNPGTEASPWRTIQKAADTLHQGQRVYVKEGTYNEKVEIKNSGNENNPIIFAAYPGHEVIIDGNGILMESWKGNFTVYNKEYIIINGFKLINSARCGVFANNSSNIFIKNNYTNNTYSSGIGIWNSNNVVVDNNEVVLACNDGDQECITVAGCDTFIIRNNHVHNSGPGSNGGEGIDAKHGANGLIYNNYVHHINRLGIYVDAWDTHTYNIMIYNNTVHNCNSTGIAAAAEAGGLLEYIRIFNNIVYDNIWTGIVVAAWGEPAASHPIKNIEIINNTIYDNGLSFGGGIFIQENNNTDEIIIINNILSKNLTFQIVSEIPSNKLTVSHNLIDGYGDYENEIRGTDYITGDPKFINPSIFDFHLSYDSPAINNGTNIKAPNFDYDNTKRPKNNQYDIGAYEY